jgi:rare lipoprotein A (peptidoglycan hydrolase)
LTLFVLTALCCSPYPEFHPDNTITTPARTEGAAPVRRPRPVIEFEEEGLASFTADEQHGRQTASGEIYNMREMVAAHRTLPFDSSVKVTNLENGKSVIVRINDRGPFVKNRIIDLSFEAAKQLDFVRQGLARVKITLVEIDR